ncbi:phosphatidylinositol kinase [Sphingobacteriaceae bacterium]|nr:phosphatidylinositol kinase [Sphingobacteriaceae bacterium]
MKIGNKLEVIYKGVIKAGILWVDDDGYHFEYDDVFINDNSVRPISVNLSKTTKTHHSKELFHYFKSILSEGENRQQICKALSIDPSDDWSLLALTCQHDTIAAITVKTI